MAYAITQGCCTDASCVSVCPVDCIHPTPDEPDFATAEMLYVDPQACIDCGACADACPVDAVHPVDRLRPAERDYARINADHFGEADAPAAGDATGEPTRPARWAPPRFPRTVPAGGTHLRVAVVGTGPAGCYAVEELLRTTDAEVTLLDRLPAPGGLVRYGVAPDHPSTRKVATRFSRLYRHPRVSTYLGVTVGSDVTHAELAAHHDAVVYAVGASADRGLDLPGEQRPGSDSATRFVAWYNAHPDVAADAFELSRTERAVVVGNGNVALDVARILVSDPDELARTDIAEHALARLRSSRVREVVVLGRRGPEQAAYSRPELRALRHVSGAGLAVDAHHRDVAATVRAAAEDSKAALFGPADLEPVDWSAPPGPGRRIVFRFWSTPLQVAGDPAVSAVRASAPVPTEPLAPAGTAPARPDARGTAPARPDAPGTDIPAGLLLRSVGHRGEAVPGLPFDPATGTVPNECGRVRCREDAAAGGRAYVVGWIKRGPSGGIGTNRRCAAETVDALVADAAAGRLRAPAGSARGFVRLLRGRGLTG